MAVANSPSSRSVCVQASRSAPVRASSSQAALIWKWREGQAGGLAAADAVLDAGVCAMADLQVLQGALAVGGVGEEDLVAHAFVQVEQRQLGTGVRGFTPDDDPGPVRVAGQVGHAGQLGDFRALAQGAVLFECGMPDLLGQGSDRLADRLGDGVSDGEVGEDSACVQGPHVVQERFRSSGAVGADEDGCAVAVGVGDLGKCLVEDGDVVGGGVGAGVAGPEESGQGFAGVVQEAQQRVVVEAALVGRPCLLFLGVAGD